MANAMLTTGQIYKVALSNDFTVGITFDGHVVTTDSRFNVSDWEDIRDVVVGSSFILGRESNGYVHLAYYDEWGKLDISNWNDVTRLAANGSGAGALALSSSGVVFGDGIFHDGIRVLEGKNQAFVTDDWTNITDISTSGWLSVGLRATGTVVYALGSDYPDSWGDTITSWTNIRKVYAGNGGVIGLQYYS